MEFEKMTKKEIRQFIRSKEDEKAKLVKRSNEADNVDDVKKAGEEMEACNEEIRKAQDELFRREDEAEERSVNGFDPNATFTARSFSMNGGSSEVATNSVENLALRSGESVASRLHLATNEKLDLGKFVRGMYTGNWNGAEAEKRAYTTSATGVVIPQILSAQIIDAARNVSLFTEAGVPVIPMTTNNLKLARVKKDPKFNFKAEGQAVANNEDMELDSVDLKTKTIYGTAYVSIEAIESSQNLTDIILRAFSQAMADGIDKGLLYGQGSDTFAPSGIMNDESVNVVEATNNRYNDFIRAIGAVRRANGTPTIMGINADTEELLNLMMDDNSNYLDVPKAVANLKQIVSNQLAYDEEDGSDALVFDPNAMVIGIQNNIRLQMITGSDECLEKGLVAFQIYSMVDGVAVRPTHIAKVTGIKDNTLHA